MKFELEEREHHLPSCKLWGSKKGMKRTAKATFPLKLAWLSARTTLACFQYTTGTSQPSLSIRCTIVVPRRNSPIYDLCYTFIGEDELPLNESIRNIELLEREILTLYTCGQASPGDVDEHSDTHAEVRFREAETMHRTNCFQMVFDEALKYWTVGSILRDDALTHTFLSCIRTLLQAYNSDKDHL